MATNYPTSLDTYVTLVDNVDDVLAAHTNDRGDAIEALEAKLGIDSSGAASAIDYFLKHASGAYRTHIHDGTSDDGPNIPVANIDGPVGKIVQVVNTQTGAVATGSTGIPHDDTIPKNDEGDEYMTLTITPTSATSKLKIEIVTNWSSNGAGYVAAALFQDAIASALRCQYKFFAANYPNTHVFSHYMVAGTTNAITFKVRIGDDTSHTITFNGDGGARKYGGVLPSSITIMEIAA